MGEYLSYPVLAGLFSEVGYVTEVINTNDTSSIAIYDEQRLMPLRLIQPFIRGIILCLTTSNSMRAMYGLAT